MPGRTLMDPEDDPKTPGSQVWSGASTTSASGGNSFRTEVDFTDGVKQQVDVVDPDDGVVVKDNIPAFGAPTRVGRIIGDLCKTALGLFFINLLAIGGYMLWQWAINR